MGTLLITQLRLHFASLPSQSTTSSELHMLPLFSFTTVTRPIVPPHNDTHGDELANSPSFPEQFISM
jgi:hypothetical protein